MATVARSFADFPDRLGRGELSSAQQRPERLNRALLPGRRVPWLAVGLDAFFYVPSKVLVNDGIGTTGFERRDHLGDLSALH